MPRLDLWGPSPHLLLTAGRLPPSALTTTSFSVSRIQLKKKNLSWANPHQLTEILLSTALSPYSQLVLSFFFGCRHVPWSGIEPAPSSVEGRRQILSQWTIRQALVFFPALTHLWVNNLNWIICTPPGQLPASSPPESALIELGSHHFTLTRMASSKKTDNNKCGQGRQRN